MPVLLNTLHASVIREGVALSDGFTEVVAKFENLVERVIAILQGI